MYAIMKDLFWGEILHIFAFKFFLSHKTNMSGTFFNNALVL